MPTKNMSVIGNVSSHDYEVKTFEEFRSIKEFTQVIDSRPENEGYMGRDLSSKDGDKEFTGTSSYKEAQHLFRYGWNEYLNAAQQLLKVEIDKSYSSLANIVSIPNIAVEGHIPHVPNAILGIPQSMIVRNRPTIKSDNKCITIYYDISRNCSNEASILIAQGIATIQLINNLERKGYRVKLNISKITEYNRDLYMYAIPIKDFDQPINIRKLLFPIAHPSMLRRFSFRWIETVPEITRHDWGYGHPYTENNFNKHSEVQEEMLKLNIISKNDIYISANSFNSEKEGTAQHIKIEEHYNQLVTRSGDRLKDM